MHFAPIPRVLGSEFRPSRWGREPRVILDNFRNCQASDRWHPEYLKSVVGHRDVSVRETNGPPRNIFQNLADGGRIPFPEYLDWVLETAHELGAIAGHYTEVSDLTRVVCESG